MSVSFQVAIDCHDPGALAAFWVEALGYVIQSPPAGFDSWEAWLRENHVPESEWNSISAIVDPDGERPRIFFQRVPEPKQGKSRMHLDVNVGGPLGTPIAERRTRVDGAVARFITLGAELVQTFEERGRVLGRHARSRGHGVRRPVAGPQVRPRGHATMVGWRLRPRPVPRSRTTSTPKTFRRCRSATS